MKAPLRAFATLLFVQLLAGCGYLWASGHSIESYTAAVEAADGCDLLGLKNALAADRSAITDRGTDYNTILHEAVIHNCVEGARYLLSEHADPNAKNVDGLTPLHIAAQRGNIPILKVLIEHRANINALDRNGWTPTDRAKRWGKEEAAKYLEAQGGKSSLSN